MSKMSDLNFDTIFALFKGEPGTRKSTAAASFPTPQYWFSFDQKMNAMMLPMKNFGTDLSQVDYDDYSDYDAAEKKLEKLQEKCPYRTIIIDSLTSAADSITEQILNLKAGTTGKGGQEKGNRIGGIPINTMEDYKAEASAFRTIISKGKDIRKFHKCNIILLAHVIGVRKTNETASSTHFSRIIMSGGEKTSIKIPSICDEVYHFNIVNELDANKPGHYELITVHTGDDFARTGLNLPQRIRFDNDSLYDKHILPAMKAMNAMKGVIKI